MFLCCLGKAERENAAALPFLFFPACPKSLCWSVISLTFPLCLAHCPHEPVQLFRGVWGSLGTLLIAPEFNASFNAWLDILMSLRGSTRLGIPLPQSMTLLPWVGGEKKAFFYEPTTTPVVHACLQDFLQHTVLPSPQGHKAMEGQAGPWVLPLSPPALGWGDTSPPLASDALRSPCLRLPWLLGKMLLRLLSHLELV